MKLQRKVPRPFFLYRHHRYRNRITPTYNHYCVRMCVHVSKNACGLLWISLVPVQLWWSVLQGSQSSSVPEQRGAADLSESLTGGGNERSWGAAPPLVPLHLSHSGPVTTRGFGGTWNIYLNRCSLFTTDAFQHWEIKIRNWCSGELELSVSQTDNIIVPVLEEATVMGPGGLALGTTNVTVPGRHRMSQVRNQTHKPYSKMVVVFTH